MSTLTITFIRHGESLDNLRMVYGGWKDAELSELGHRQAKALGASFAKSNTKFDAIYASDLLRAYCTACAVQEASPGTPEVIKNVDLRERYWGVAEGHHYGDERLEGVSLEESIAQGIYPVLLGREERFPEGESAIDLNVRASRAVRQYVAQHLGEGETNIAIASHGLCIGELMSSVVSLDSEADQSRNFTGLRNTGTLRAIVGSTQSLTKFVSG
jgi:broad specificity phosphatase PhoE